MSEDNKFLERIMDRLKENSDTLAAMDKKMDLHIQETKFELASIKRLDEIQNAILQEHHDRSVQLKRDNELREASLRKEMQDGVAAQNKRLEKLEAPGKWWALTKRWALIGSSISTAAIALYEAMKALLGN